MPSPSDHGPAPRPFTIERILLGVDFGSAGDAAVREAGLLARTFGAELRLGHVLTAVRHGDEDEAVMTHHIEGMLARMARELEADGVRVGHPFLLETHSHPADTLLRWSDEVRADLIVLGAGAKSTLERLTVGSTAERVVRSSSLPVWLTRPTRAHAEIRRILCAVDGSSTSRAGLAIAVGLARTFVAELVSVCALPAGESSDLEEAIAAIDLHGVTHREQLLVGEPAERIVEAASATGADLLVLGSRGRTGLARLVLGSTAEALLRKVPCSLLVVHAGA